MEKKALFNDPQMHISDDLMEVKDHGDSEYPVGAYLVNLQQMYGGFVRWHWHEEFEIAVVKKGKAIFYANDKPFELSEGQGIFINQNVLHSVHPCEGTNCIYYSFVVNSSLLLEHGNTRLATKYMLPLTNNKSMRYLVFDQTEPFHKDLVEYMDLAYDANVRKEFGYELETRNYLTSFWLTMLRRMHAENVLSHKKTVQVTSDELRAKTAILFIQEHYAEPITLTEIADYVHISKGECCRCFKRSVRMSPFEYLMQYRIFMAVTIMSSAQAPPISQLAMKVGFNSSSYFNKVFKKHLHCTPTQYRTKFLKNVANPIDYFGFNSLDVDLLNLEDELLKMSEIIDA